VIAVEPGAAPKPWSRAPGRRDRGNGETGRRGHGEGETAGRAESRELRAERDYVRRPRAGDMARGSGEPGGTEIRRGGTGRRDRGGRSPRRWGIPNDRQSQVVMVRPAFRIGTNGGRRGAAGCGQRVDGAHAAAVNLWAERRGH
jgi:hypothetical protein